MWYTSTDAKTVIDGEGYFNDVSDLLKVGDLIYVHASIWWYELTPLPVVSNASGVVDISDGTTISVLITTNQ